ncbi:LytTR family DNA-binding domain-containing protein [Lachnospiraceae bacterium OttesenSCG-928-E19]|nr:LytTR family DNA-binding domain-containing protein [Lachnospiraceae bacterium OttesenSCG-928-E19]
MRIAICDDILEHRQECESKLKELSQKNKVAIEIIQFEKSENLLFSLEDEEQKIDVIYLDISMPGQSGIEAAKKIREMDYQCEIIFFTVKDYCWKQAFSLRAFHYIVKGEYTDEEFEEIFMAVTEEVKRNTEDRLLFSCAGDSRNIRVSDIEYFEIRSHVVTVHYKGNETFEFYTPLKKLEKILMKKSFLRCHKSFLVSKSHVDKIVAQELITINGNRIPLGRTYKNIIIEELSKTDKDV